MVGLIAVVIIAAVVLLGEQLRDLFTSITDELGGAGRPGRARRRLIHH